MEAWLLLADGRFPGGGYAHSGGLEPAVADGSVHDVSTLGEFVRGRLYTVGALEAWAAARAAAVSVAVAGALLALDDEIDARTLSPVLRAASRALGRGLRRSAQRAWPAAGAIEAEHQPVVLGAVAALAGLSAIDAARLSVHHHVMAAVSAAPKLLPIDTADAVAIVARLAGDCDAVALAGAVCDCADAPPPWTAPLVELRSIDHAEWEVRLFAS
jgi:urease accessory protein